MLRSIRSQILVPLVAIQGVAVATVALTAATLAARRSEQQIVGRLNEVIATLGESNFPYTPGVLARMRGLSGAHFVVYDPDGRVRESTLPGLDALPAAARSVRASGRLGSLGRSPRLALGGTRYFALPLRTASGAPGSSLLVLYPETSWRQARWEAAASPLWVGLGTLGLMAAAAAWTAHRISARLGSVRRQVARIAAGDFRALDPGPGRDEVQELARSINVMSARLDEMQQTIRRSERTRLLAQLAAGLAHQLRNSLTGARMSIQLHAKRFPPPSGDESLSVALRQLAMTEEHVKGILSLGRAERRPHAPCELEGLLGEVAVLVGATCQHARVRLRHDRGKAPRPVLADEAGLRAAVLNLTVNAIEAASPGGEVSLTLAPGETEVTIVVGDDGPGPRRTWPRACSSRSSPPSPKGSGSGWRWRGRSPTSTAAGSTGAARATGPFSA